MTYNVLMGTLNHIHSLNVGRQTVVARSKCRRMGVERYKQKCTVVMCVCVCVRVCVCVCVALFVGGGAESSPAAGEPMPTGVRSVSAPVYDPSQHQTEQAQYMTCKVCGALIT